MKGITIIVAAYNEQSLITATVEAVLEGLECSGLDPEILVIDDCSRDGTSEFCAAASELSDSIKYIRNDVNQGFGGVYWKGISLATKEYCMIIPGDNPVGASGLKRMFTEVGRADIISPYVTNREVRNFGRRIVSRAYTGILNAIMGRSLKYYCGWVIHRTENVRHLPTITASFAFQAEVLCEVLRRGASILEVGVELQEYAGRKSTAFRPKNVLGVWSTLVRLAIRRVRGRDGWPRALAPAPRSLDS
jgi:glycosyltransferase involved in cell wall biosynthesis